MKGFCVMKRTTRCQDATERCRRDGGGEKERKLLCLSHSTRKQGRGGSERCLLSQNEARIGTSHTFATLLPEKARERRFR